MWFFKFSIVLHPTLHSLQRYIVLQPLSVLLLTFRMDFILAPFAGAALFLEINTELLAFFGLLPVCGI